MTLPHAGRFVTERLDYDGGRDVTAYIPSLAPEAIVFAGDGALIAPWGRLLQTMDLLPTMVVGVHRAEDEGRRLNEYVLGENNEHVRFDHKQFAAHESFVVEDVRRWVETRFTVSFPADRTAVCGVSASGEFALALGLRYPDLFGTVFCASPGVRYRPPLVMPHPLPRVYLVAGLQEPFFRDNAVRWADALRDADAEVMMVERTGSHGGDFWQAEFPLMVAWAFNREAPRF